MFIKFGLFTDDCAFSNLIVEFPCFKTFRISNENAFFHVHIYSDPFVFLDMNVFLFLYSIFLFDVRILNVALYVSRRGMYACVHRWAICVRPRGV